MFGFKGPLHVNVRIEYFFQVFYVHKCREGDCEPLTGLIHLDDLSQVFHK